MRRNREGTFFLPHAISILVVALVAVVDPRAGEPSLAALTAPMAEGEVLQLISDLSDPSYDRRTFATRRLLAIGMPAYPALQQTAGSGDLESALRAKRIIGVLETLLFSGCEIEIEFSKPKTAWNEPVSLVVTVHNKAAFAAQIPFEQASSGDAIDEARQVANMLDVGEWLLVFGPDGRQVTLKVDEISADPRVVNVVQARLNSAPISTIPAGGKVRLVVELFNRGWARFPLLEAGEYSVVFDYTPQWSDPVLADAKVGRLRSNLTNIEVTGAAPLTVSRTGIEAELSLARAGDELIATLVNRADVATVLNINFGPAPPFAQAVWVHESAERLVEVPATPPQAQSWKDFRDSRLVELGPGETLELARVSLAELGQALTERGADLTGAAGAVRFHYTNVCDRHWQGREESNLQKDPSVPDVLRRPLPRRLITLHQTSQALPGDSLK